MKNTIFNFIFISTMCIIISLSGTIAYAQEKVFYGEQVQEIEGNNDGEVDTVYEEDSDTDKGGGSENKEREIENRVTDESIDTDRIIDNVKEKGKEGIETSKDAVSKAGDVAENAVNEGVYRFWEGFFGIHNSIKTATPLILTVSISFGTVIAVMSRKNKGLKRWVIISLYGIVPIFNLLVVYGMPYIYLIFFRNMTYSVKSQITADKGNAGLLFYDLTIRGGDRIAADVSVGNTIEGCIYNFWNGCNGFHGLMKIITPLIIVGSFTLGVVIALLARENKRLRRWAIIALCFAIPIIDIVIVSGVPFLQHVFK